jgi:hypothetical protein
MGCLIDRDAFAARVLAIIRRLGSATTSTVELELGRLGCSLVRETLAQLVRDGKLSVAVETVRCEVHAPGSSWTFKRECQAKVYRLTNSREEQVT